MSRRIWSLSVSFLTFCLTVSCGFKAGPQNEASSIAEPSEISGTNPAHTQTLPSISTSPPPTAFNAEFRDVLNEFMGLNERLDRIASRIKIANADVCATTEADIGITTHTLRDYPEELRPAAAHYLNVDNKMSIRTVRAGSAASHARLAAGDRIIRVNGESLTDGPIFSDPQLAGAVAKALFHTTLNTIGPDNFAHIDYVRHDQTYAAQVPITQQCQLPVTLFFSDNINGHYIDGEIWMTSGLLRDIQDDVRVAYIMAHEMAHALKEKKTKARTPEIELEADRIGLILLARAGYDPSELATFWAEQLNLFDGGEHGSETHPSLQRRADNYALTLSYIRAARGDRDKLKALFVPPE